MDARVFGHLDGVPAAPDVLLRAAGEAADLDAVAGLSGDGLDGVEVALAGGGEARLDDVDAEDFELVSDAELLAEVHGAAGGLLAVAKRGVEEDDLIGNSHREKLL